MEKNSELIMSRINGIDKSYLNVLNLTTENMVSLCRQNSTATRDRYSIIEIERRISVNIPYSICLTSNYIAFKNPSYGNMWYFAFIDDVEYISDGACEITYTIDVWSTWHDYWTPRQCYVLREHVNNDTIGANLKPEPITLDKNNLTYNDELKVSGFDNSSAFWVVISSGISSLSGVFSPQKVNGVTAFNGHLSGAVYYPVLYDRGTTSLRKINERIESFLRTGVDGAIISIFTVPLWFITPDDINSETGALISNELSATIPENLNDVIFSKNDLNQSVDYTYAPKNNKVYTFPYHFLQLNVGNQMLQFEIEKFNDRSDPNQISFKVEYAISPNRLKSIIFPKYYKEIFENIDLSANVDTFPPLNFAASSEIVDSISRFNNNMFTSINAVNDNAVGMFDSIFGGVKEAGGGGASMAGGIVHGVGGVISTTMTTMKTFSDMIIENYTSPVMQKGVSENEVLFAYQHSQPRFYNVFPTYDEMKKIDNFFTKYGYTVEELKTPNLTGRRYFNYVKIAPDAVCCVDAIPDKYKSVINNILRNGVTVWHDYSRIGNYEDNEI